MSIKIGTSIGGIEKNWCLVKMVTQFNKENSSFNDTKTIGYHCAKYIF